MDPLSISASVIAVLQLTGTVIGYIKETSDGGEDRKRILDEAHSIHYILFLLKDEIERQQREDAWSDTVRFLKAPLEHFKSALERLVEILKPAKGLKKVGKTLSWPFRKEEVEEILSTVERHKSLFLLVLENDHVYHTM